MLYMVRFIGHVVENKRLDGFPKQIYSDFFFECKDQEELRGSIKKMYQIFIAQDGMIVPKDASAIQEEVNFEYDKSMFVPLSTLVYITTETKKVTGSFPILTEDGSLQLLDGTKARIQ